MAFQQVSTARRYIKPSECVEGQIVVEGYYIGPIASSFGGFDHLFRTKDGKEVVLNKSGHLAHCMKQVTEKSLCQVTYLGTTKLPAGHKYAKMNKDVHNYGVLTDPDDVFKGFSSVANVAAPVEDASAEDTDDEDVGL